MATAVPPDKALSVADGFENEEEEQRWLICHFPAKVDHPLCHPYACSGNIKFVHDNYLLRWPVTCLQPQCESCSAVDSLEDKEEETPPRRTAPCATPVPVAAASGSSCPVACHPLPTSMRGVNEFILPADKGEVGNKVYVGNTSTTDCYVYSLIEGAGLDLMLCENYNAHLTCCTRWVALRGAITDIV